MATMNGLATYIWLVERGWTAAPEKENTDPADMPIGDPMVVDPISGMTMGLYEAARLERKRTGEYPEFLVG